MSATEIFIIVTIIGVLGQLVFPQGASPAAR